MGDGIDQIAERLNGLITDTKADYVTRLGASDTADGPSAERTLSNTSLLLESLATFYGDLKSEFFPTVITASIRERLIQAESTFADLPPVDQPVPADSALNLLNQLESLYAYCLQYGLITYGFTGKIAQQQIELIRQARQQTEAAAQKMLAATEGHESEFASTLDAFGKSLTQADLDFKTQVADRVTAVQPAIEELAGLLAAGKVDAAALGDFLKAATDHAAAVQKTRTDLDTASSQATTEFSTRKTTADTELTTIQALGTQVQKYEADAKAMHKGVTDTQATIKNQLTEITAFYGEIETHRLQMTETGKAAQSHLGELRESSEKSVADLRERTEQVVKTNESLIGQINDHLLKAIGVSLFTALDKRRRHVSIASWVWGGILLLSVCGMIWYAVWFVEHFAELAKLAELAKSDVPLALVYARLVIVAPLAFLIVFATKQYGRERRAEAEYGFKSAISVSLEPYRDLIARMKKDGQDTAFVERLILEIFDNPANRLYAAPATTKEKEGLDVWGRVKEIIDTFHKRE